MSSLFLSIIIVFSLLLFGIIVLSKFKRQADRLKQTERMLVNSLQNEKNYNARISKILHNKLQSDLIAIKYFTFIYSQVSNEKVKSDAITDIELALESSIANAKNLNEKLMPPFLKNDIIKALEYYFEKNTKLSATQFLIKSDVISISLSDERAFELYKIIEMFCDHIVEDGSAKQFVVKISESEIELTDDGNPFLLDLDDELTSEILFLSLACRLKILNGVLIRKSTERGNHFVLKII